MIDATCVGVDVARRPVACPVRNSLHRRARRRWCDQHGRRAAAAPRWSVDALDDQLDFAAPLTRPLDFLVYENTAWIAHPQRSSRKPMPTPARQAGFDSLARLELSGAATPVAVGAADNADVSFAAEPGAVTVATGVDERWTMQSRCRVDRAPTSIRDDNRIRHHLGWVGHPAISHVDLASFRVDRPTGAVAVARVGHQQVRHVLDRSLAAAPVSAAPEAPLLSIDAPVEAPTDGSVLVTLNDDTVPWQNSPRPGPAEDAHRAEQRIDAPDRDVADQQAGVE